MMVFLGRSTLEDTLHFVFQGRTRSWELNWDTTKDARKWSLRGIALTDGPALHPYERAGLLPDAALDMLRQDAVSEQCLETELSCVVWQQVAFAKGIVDDARDAFGEAAVVEACQQVDQFCDEVRGVVERFLSPPTPPPPGRLRLV